MNTFNMHDLIGKRNQAKEARIKINGFTAGLEEAIKQIHAIYEEHGYNEDLHPPIECPWCGAETKLYSCAWDYNKHVSLACSACKLSIRQ